MSQALCFNEITFSPVTHQNSLWIRAAELARALGFTREDKVAQIYQRHADEFTPDMTQLIEIVAEPQNEVPGNMGAGRCRIFSLRGCHLLAMFARTPVAKQFRHWVLDVLDKLAEEERAKTKPVENPDKLPTPDAPLTPDQQCTLQAIVRAKVEALPREQRGGLYPKTWSRFNNHFRLAKYCQLPQSRLSEAVAYLTQLDMTEGKQALPTAPTAVPGVEEDLAFIRACTREIMERERRMYFTLREALPPLRGVTRPLALRLHESMDAGSVLLDAALKQVENTARLVIEYGRG